MIRPDDHPADLSALGLPPERRERMAAEIVRRAMPALARGVAPRGPLSLLAGWARPALAAAAAVAGLSLAALAGDRARDPERQPELVASVSVAEGLDIPAPAEDWVVEERAPTDADLIRALEGDAP